MIDPPVKVGGGLVVVVIGPTVMIGLVRVGTTGGPVMTGGLFVVAMGLDGTTGGLLVTMGAVVLGPWDGVLGGGAAMVFFFEGVVKLKKDMPDEWN
jgi:hypothetical protein